MQYHYTGGGMTIFERFMEPDVTRNLVTNDFERLDRFGRVIDHRWHDNDASTMRARFTYGHDRAGNRTFRDNELDADHGELYDHDDLHRLVDLQRGELNGTQDAIVTNELAFQQNWTLSMLGNWRSFDEDDDGDATWDLEQTRSHSEANEIDGIDETTGSSWTTPSHDANGNMTSLPQPDSPTSSYTATYDAWNRMVKLEDDGTSNTVAEYEYDGLNRRIVKKVYASGVLDETRHVYYSQRWQVLEVRVDGTADTDAEIQYLWGQRYVDDLILRDRDTTGNGTLDERLYALQDANFNVTAILDDTGAVLERYRYTPYGQRTVLDDDWSDDADGLSDHGFALGHQGLLHDAESGLVYNRWRMLHPGLGRFMQRDALTYVDGMSFYAYYAGMRGAMDPYGRAVEDLPVQGDGGTRELESKNGRISFVELRGNFKYPTNQAAKDRNTVTLQWGIRMSFQYSGAPDAHPDGSFPICCDDNKPPDKIALRLLRRRAAAVWQLRNDRANYEAPGYEGRDHISGKFDTRQRLELNHPEYLPEEIYEVDHDTGLTAITLGDSPTFGIPPRVNNRRLRISHIESGGQRLDFTIVVLKQCERDGAQRFQEVDRVLFGFIVSYHHDDRNKQGTLGGWQPSFITGEDAYDVPDTGARNREVRDSGL